MPRVSDVDTIAPDDPVTTPTPTPRSVLNSPASELKKSKKKKRIILDSPNTITPPSPPSSGTVPIIDSVYRILGHAKSPLSSLLINPHVFNFSERDDDEEILVVARQHWFTNVRWILATFVLILLPSLFRFVPNVISIPLNYQFIGYLFLYLLTFAYAFEKFLSWYFNVYIITSQRVIDIDFNNLLTKKYSEAGLEQIQDVTSEVIGALPTMFNYGNILIQTASEVNELVFERVPDPEKLIKVLQELRDHQPKGGNL
jgi:hypothetical protein